MNRWLIIPVKPPGQAKSRLSEVLGEEQRAALAQAMFHHVVKAASGAEGVAQIALLGPSRLGAPEDLPLLSDPGGGLNPALQSALVHVVAQRADRMIILFADLPQLCPGDVEQLADAPGDTVRIAPDRHGTGTNALSLPIPAGGGFTFAFGPDSFAAHRAEAGRLGLRIEEVHSHGLACDVDMPEDLADAESLLGPAN